MFINLKQLVKNTRIKTSTTLLTRPTLLSKPETICPRAYRSPQNHFFIGVLNEVSAMLKGKFVQKIANPNKHYKENLLFINLAKKRRIQVLNKGKLGSRWVTWSQSALSFLEMEGGGIWRERPTYAIANVPKKETVHKLVYNMVLVNESENMQGYRPLVIQRCALTGEQSTLDSWLCQS